MAKNTKVVTLIGGGVGSSIFTKSLLALPVDLNTIVSSFDDGGSTGSLRRDYGGIALGDFRQCLVSSIEIEDVILHAINYRFGGGNLFGVNVGNLFIKSFLEQFPTERKGVLELHRLFKLKNNVIPVSYKFAHLCAKLTNNTILNNQNEIATYLNFSESGIKSLFLDKEAPLSPEARKSIRESDFLVFAPGHFFTSVLPHLLVKDFAKEWKKSKAKKVWFLNLLAHKGQDNFYSFQDYLKWFEDHLGKHPFDMVVVNKKVPTKILKMVQSRFQEVKFTKKDFGLLKSQGMRCDVADLVSTTIRKQKANDTVMRAPLRHDENKIRKYFQKLINE